MHYVSEGVAVQIVFPVRYVSEDVAVQTTSRELSASGIGVRSLAPPQVGAHVLLTLYLPNAGAPEMAVGRVARRRADQPADAGFWAAFLVVDPQARMRISQLLAEQHDPNEHHRGLERHPVKLQVRFGSAREFVLEYATNLSRSGIFVGCDDPPPLDTAVEVEVQLPDGGPAVSSGGIVVHRHLPGNGKPAGAGVQFVDTNDAFRDRIDRYVETLLLD